MPTGHTQILRPYMIIYPIISNTSNSKVNNGIVALLQNAGDQSPKEDTNLPLIHQGLCNFKRYMFGPLHLKYQGKMRNVSISVSSAKFCQMPSEIKVTRGVHDSFQYTL